MRTVLFIGAAGGVGTTALTVGVGHALTRCGKRVIVTEFPTYTRAMDLALGLSDRVIVHLADVLGGAAVENALLPVSLPAEPRTEKQKPQAEQQEQAGEGQRVPSLSFLPGAPEPFPLSLGELRDFTWRVEETGCDFLLIDGGVQSEHLYTFIDICTEIVVAITPTEVCLRAAEAIGQMLCGTANLPIKLLVNAYPVETPERALPLSQAVERTRLPLLGVVPLSYALARATEEGRLLTGQDNAVCALENIALRLTGKERRLFASLRQIPRKKLIR